MREMPAVVESVCGYPEDEEPALRLVVLMTATENL